MDTEMSFADDPVAATSREAPADKAAPAAWNTPKYMEECDSYYNKLRDQVFNPADFGDPLDANRRVKSTYVSTFPEGTEDRLLAVVAQYQTGPQ